VSELIDRLKLMASGNAEVMLGDIDEAADALEAQEAMIAALERLREYGEAKNDGTNDGTLFRFEGGKWFFLALTPSLPK